MEYLLWYLCWGAKHGSLKLDSKKPSTSRDEQTGHTTMLHQFCILGLTLVVLYCDWLTTQTVMIHYSQSDHNEIWKGVWLVIVKLQFIHFCLTFIALLPCPCCEETHALWSQRWCCFFPLQSTWSPKQTLPSATSCFLMCDKCVEFFLLWHSFRWKKSVLRCSLFLTSFRHDPVNSASVLLSYL